MPLLWRYLLSHYLKVFVLCVISFIAILLTMRLNEIAYFATLGPQFLTVLWFVFQQIPYIIPIALPVSALISSILLVQTLSQAHELTAMRACGFALRDILAPILIASLFLSLANFYTVSELSTTAHMNAGRLKNQLRSINPLLLLHNKNIMRMKGFYADTLGPSRLGDFAQEVILFSPNKHENRLNMMVAKQLEATPLHFIGTNMTLLTSRHSKKNVGDENLILENIARSTTTIQDFAQMLEKKIWSVNSDHLRLPQLLVRLDEARMELANATGADMKQARNAVNRCLTEIIRRFSVALAVFSFTLMGLSFGISVSRNPSNRSIFFITVLGAIFLVPFFIAKNFDHAILAAASLYLVPHLIICLASLWTLRRIAHGIE